MHTKGIGITSNVVNGLTPFSSETDLYGCDVYFTFKTRINAAGKVNKRMDLLTINQRLRLDWVFMMQKYHDE